MPVLVTGAETGLGRATVLALLRGGGEVRAYLEPGAGGRDALAGSGCKLSIGEIDDEGRLELALEQVHTVVHCWGGPLTEPDSERNSAAAVLSAALGAGCRRIVWASHLGADDPADNAYLEACADIESLLQDAPIESIVVRRALTYGSGDALTAALAAGAGAAVRPDAQHAPLAQDDLVAAIVQADAQERTTTASDLAIRIELAGPQVMAFGDFIRVLRGRRRRGRADALPPWTIDLYSRDLIGGAQTLGRTGIPPAQGVARLAR